MTLPTRTQIDGWPASVSHLFDSADSYRAAAERLETVNGAHVAQVASPGGSAWHGDAADQAREATYADRGAVNPAADHLRRLASIAESGGLTQRRAHSEVVDAIAAAEADHFKVGDDLSITDGYTYSTRDIALQLERNAKARRHLDAITTAASALVAHGDSTGRQLTQGAVGLLDMTPGKWVQSVDYSFKRDVPTPTPAPQPPGVINLGAGDDKPSKCTPWQVTKYTAEALAAAGGLAAIIAGEVPTAGLATSGLGTVLYGLMDAYDNFQACK
jgi:hypothetical protein